MFKKVCSLILLLLINNIYAQVERVEPPHWWTGFNNTELQLLIKNPGIGKMTPEISYDGITINKVSQAASPNYLFIDLNISENTQPGTFKIRFKNENKTIVTQDYELKKRKQKGDGYQGFNSSDVIYLITPDRFANGNPENDIQKNLLEKHIDRKDDYARHGGDIRGIINHLDYIADLGFTAIWSNPLLINDMPQGSYHGYAITDYYQVDPRFGTLSEYIELAEKAKKNGIKLIMDQIANHCGLQHWWMKDLPFKDWVNYQENYEKNIDDWNWKVTKFSNHRRTVNQDIYASESDKKEMTDGWFVDAMPDLNQRNPYMAQYIIQNSIWWIETLGLGGIRQDTYPYPDKAFMADWAGAIMLEYPNFSIVGEEWSYNPLLIQYWQKGANNRDGYHSNLTSTMDFAMQQKIVEALNEEEQWDKGLIKIYEGLANDFAYPSPENIMVFPDNHDMSRIYTQLKGDITNTKMALAVILTIPRIPQIYYGTEILMDDFEKPGDHGLIRTDFPGGWIGDEINAFTGKGLSAEQKEMKLYVKKLLNFRKKSQAIQQGKTVHFVPKDGVYVLCRYTDTETVLLILNKNTKPIRLDIDRFKELGLKDKQFINIISGKEEEIFPAIELKSRGVLMFSANLK